MSEQAALALAAGAGVVAIVVLLVAWRMRARTRTRIQAALARLEAGSLVGSRSMEATLAQLERAVDRTVARSGDASAAETRMAHALSAIDAGVVMLDETGEIVFRNAQAAVFLGARHGEALVESAIDELAERALAGHDESRTLELFGPPRRTIVLSAETLDDGHRGIGALVLIDDITERRRIDAVRRDFVANISHELKTPVGGLGVLAETIVDEDDLGVIRRLAGRMHVEAMRASRTIDDLLELSRIESGDIRHAEPVPVHLVLAEAVERAANAAEQRGILLELEEPAPGLEVLGDRRQMQSAVFNLLDNAIKYSQPDGRVRVGASLAGDRVRIAVIDHGIGIPRRDLERIFERFYRVDRARSRDTGGTGLGLAIVRHVASNHGGEIEVESREGAGSTFTLVLPAARTGGTTTTTTRSRPLHAGSGVPPTGADRGAEVG